MAVVYEALGSTINASASNVTTTNFTCTHTAGGGGTNVVVLLGSFYCGNGFSSWTITATYGSTSMTSLASQVSADSRWGSVAFGLRNPPAGTQTVTVTVSGPLESPRFEGNTVSYNNAWDPTAVIASGTNSSTTSVTVSSATDAMVCASQQCWGNVTISSVSGTQRGTTMYNGINQFAINDTTGSSSTTLTATLSGSTANWIAIGVNVPAVKDQNFFAFFS